MKKGEIYSLSLPGVYGHEQAGERPGVVASNLANGMIVVIPLTSNLESLRFSHSFSILPDDSNGLSLESVALVFQLRSLDKRRAIKRVGTLSKKDTDNVNKSLKNLLLLK